MPVGEEVNEAGGHTAKDIKKKVSDVPKAILHIIAKDVEKPHITKDMKEPPMEKHRGEERKKLLECCEVGRYTRIRVSNGNHSVEVKGLI